MKKEEKSEMKYYFEKEEKNCFFCRENIPKQILVFCLIALSAAFVYNFFNKTNYLKYNEFSYTLSAIYLTGGIDFNFIIKNLKAEKRSIMNEKFFFNVFDNTNTILYSDNVSLSDQDFQPEQEKDLKISLNKDRIKSGNFKIVLFIDENKSKKIEYKFSVKE
jgi:hypothetical protein